MLGKILGKVVGKVLGGGGEDKKSKGPQDMIGGVLNQAKQLLGGLI